MAKILIIEDEEHIRDELFDWLSFEGYDVCYATNGKEGVDVALAEMPDLIISDIRMPIMDGREVLRHIRASPDLCEVPFVFLTASAERDSMRMGMNLGADDYITKPFTVDEILNTVEAQITKHRLHTKTWEERVKKLSTALDNEREARLLKSRLVAMFSHDFRNPLALIRTSSDLLLNYEGRISPEKRRRKLEQITSAVLLLTQMLDDMLLTAELEHGKFVPNLEEANIVPFVQKIVQEFADIYVATHTITYQYEAEIISINFDQKLVRQALVNILSNALKYSPDASEVVVRVARQTQFVTISVQDHGIGIPNSYLPMLFEPFERADNANSFKGTGLGLSITKQALDHCDGLIHVESQEGVGTTITISLPC